MSIAVVGSDDFSLGFMLAGIDKVFRTDADNAPHTLKDILEKEEYAIVIVQEELIDTLPRHLRYRVTNAIKPLFVGVGHSTGSDLQEKVKRAVGIDLMNKDEPSGSSNPKKQVSIEEDSGGGAK